MKHTNSLLWGSVSILIGIVIAILALVRGVWQVTLLITAFAVWGLYLIFILLIPLLRSNRELRRRERRAERGRQALEDANLSVTGVTDRLLRDVSFRISDYLKSAFPNVRWEWAVEFPAEFAVHGGTARIRVYGVPDFDFADVTIDSRMNLTCSLLKVVPVQGQGTEETLPPNQQPVDPQVWYELQGRQVLETLVADLNSRRYNKLYLHEDGSISIQPEEGDTEPVQESFKSFPEKVYWSRLAQVLDQEGLSATVQDNCIQVSW